MLQQTRYLRCWSNRPCVISLCRFGACNKQLVSFVKTYRDDEKLSDVHESTGGQSRVIIIYIYIMYKPVHLQYWMCIDIWVDGSADTLKSSFNKLSVDKFQTSDAIPFTVSVVHNYWKYLPHFGPPMLNPWEARIEEVWRQTCPEKILRKQQSSPTKGQQNSKIFDKTKVHLEKEQRYKRYDLYLFKFDVFF